MAETKTITAKIAPSMTEGAKSVKPGIRTPILQPHAVSLTLQDSGKNHQRINGKEFIIPKEE